MAVLPGATALKRHMSLPLEFVLFGSSDTWSFQTYSTIFESNASAISQWKSEERLVLTVIVKSLPAATSMVFAGSDIPSSVELGVGLGGIGVAVARTGACVAPLQAESSKAARRKLKSIFFT